MVPLGDSYDSSTIEPLIGGLRRFAIAIDSPLDFLTIEPLIGGLIQKFLNYFLTGLTRY